MHCSHSVSLVFFLFFSPKLPDVENLSGTNKLLLRQHNLFSFFFCLFFFLPAAVSTLWLRDLLLYVVVGACKGLKDFFHNFFFMACKLVVSHFVLGVCFFYWTVNWSLFFVSSCSSLVLLNSCVFHLHLIEITWLFFSNAPTQPQINHATQSYCLCIWHWHLSEGLKGSCGHVTYGILECVNVKVTPLGLNDNLLSSKKPVSVFNSIFFFIQSFDFPIMTDFVFTKLQRNSLLDNEHRFTPRLVYLRIDKSLYLYYSQK